MGTSSSAAHLLAEDLQQSDLHERVVRLVGSRVPAADCDDVVQTALSAALSSRTVPRERVRRRRWLVGLTKHKIADYYRAAQRRAPAALDEGIDTRQPVEARDVLTRIAHDLESDPRALKTLEWILREHQGEPLADIAREESLPSATVRKRVSRLRQALRKKWLPAAAALFACLALVMGSGEHGAPSGAPIPVSTEAARGTWHVVGVHTSSADPRAAATARAMTAGLELTIDGDRLHIEAPFGERRGHLLPTEDPRRFVVDDGTGRHSVHVLFQSERSLVLEGSYGAWSGRIELGR